MAEEESFEEFLDRLEKVLRDFEEYQEIKDKFTWELIDRVSLATHQHFSGEKPHPHLELENPLTESEWRNKIIADKDFKYYGIWIFEELISCMQDFSDYNNPPDRELQYKEINFPSFTEEELEAKVQRFSRKLGDITPEDVELLRENLREDAIIEEYYTRYKILIHDTLKKLTVDFFPEIMEITADGIREINYLLYQYMLMINDNIMNMLE